MSVNKLKLAIFILRRRQEKNENMGGEEVTGSSGSVTAPSAWRYSRRSQQ